MTEKDLEIQELRRELDEARKKIKALERKPITNYDRIKALSVEEMANLLHSVSCCIVYSTCDGCPLEVSGDCEVSGIMDWLESEVDDGGIYRA